MAEGYRSVSHGACSPGYHRRIVGDRPRLPSRAFVDQSSFLGNPLYKAHLPSLTTLRSAAVAGTKVGLDVGRGKGCSHDRHPCLLLSPVLFLPQSPTVVQCFQPTSTNSPSHPSTCPALTTHSPVPWRSPVALYPDMDYYGYWRWMISSCCCGRQYEVHSTDDP